MLKNNIKITFKLSNNNCERWYVHFLNTNIKCISLLTNIKSLKYSVKMICISTDKLKTFIFNKQYSTSRYF